MTLRIIRNWTEPEPGDTSPVAWFAELVDALDRVDLERAVAAQRELERKGFRVSCKRRPPRRQGGGR